MALYFEYQINKNVHLQTVLLDILPTGVRVFGNQGVSKGLIIDESKKTLTSVHLR